MKTPLPKQDPVTIDACIQKSWNISQQLERLYSPEKIRALLQVFNQIGDGNYYMVDYQKQRIYTDNSPARILSGYAKDLIKQENLDFYARILENRELYLLHQINLAAHDIFYKYDEQERKYLIFTYDLLAKNKRSKDIVLRHKLTPYQLCENGNFWLGLCHVTMLPPLLSTNNKASVTHIRTGEKHVFMNGAFIRADIDDLTEDEIEILILFGIDGLYDKEICPLLCCSANTLSRKKQKISEKLGVKSISAAVYRAQFLGII